MNSSPSGLMGYCTLAIEFLGLKNYTSYYYINYFSLLRISFLYRGYIYSRVRRNVKSQFFPNRVFWRLDLATGLSRKFKPWANGLASLGLLSCSATAGVTLQLLACLTRVQPSGGLQAASHLRDPVASPYFFAQSWAFFHTLSHTTLTWFPPKYRITNC